MQKYKKTFPLSLLQLQNKGLHRIVTKIRDKFVVYRSITDDHCRDRFRHEQVEKRRRETPCVHPARVDKWRSGTRNHSPALWWKCGWVALEGVRKAWGEVPSATLLGDHVLVRVGFQILPFSPWKRSFSSERLTILSYSYFATRR